MSFDDASIILDQSSAALRSQATLSAGLRSLAVEAPTRHRREVLEALAARLENGEPFASILATVEPQLAPLLTATGACHDENLPVILQWAADALRRRRALNFQLELALLYPLVLMAIGTWILLAILFLVFPILVPLLDDYPLPASTEFLIAVCLGGKALGMPYVLMVLPIVAAALFIIPLVRGVDSVGWRSWLRPIPLVGILLHDASVVEFCGLLAGLVRGRVPLPAAVRLAGLGTGDPRLMRGTTRYSVDLERGQNGTSACVDAGLPSAVGLMLRESTSPEHLAESLEGLAEVYISRLDVRSRVLAAYVEPIVMVLMVVGLFTLIITIFGPILGSLRDLV